jgi:hypothetical protein
MPSPSLSAALAELIGAVQIPEASLEAYAHWLIDRIGGER